MVETVSASRWEKRAPESRVCEGASVRVRIWTRVLRVIRRLAQFSSLPNFRVVSCWQTAACKHWMFSPNSANGASALCRRGTGGACATIAQGR